MLPTGFAFSQHSLGDFKDCARRFYLRYIAQQKWPLVEASPVGGLSALQYREYLRKGALLHRWIERHWLGVSERRASDDIELETWWARFCETRFDDLPAQRQPELELAAPLGDFRLYARFDLLAHRPASADEPGRAVVVDWKTLRGDRPPRYDMLKRRIQTRVYLYVLATASAPFNNGAPFEPEQCSLRYWLANFPEQPWAEISYSRAEYEADTIMLHKLTDDIVRRSSETEFEKTSDERRCLHCEYATLCQRAGHAGNSDVDDENVTLDLETVGELEY